MGNSAPTEWSIEGHGYSATIDAVGATLRRLTFRDRDLVVPYNAGSIRPLYRGALVAPWPNRIRDGRYTFRGNSYQAPLNEVDRHHALHGLVQWVRWEATEIAESRLVLQHNLVPQDGYPFALTLIATFEITADGLVSTLATTNTGDETAPYGCCPHPYLLAGPGLVDEWSLTMQAGTRLEVDDRLIPVGTADVAQVNSDFRSGRVIGKQEIDHAFTDLASAAPGDRHRVTVLAADGRTGVEMAWGAWGSWLQIHTADRPEAVYNRVGLAVEPMSCPPDAFNSDPDVVALQAGSTHTAEWTISAIEPQSAGL